MLSRNSEAAAPAEVLRRRAARATQSQPQALLSPNLRKSASICGQKLFLAPFCFLIAWSPYVWYNTGFLKPLFENRISPSRPAAGPPPFPMVQNGAQLRVICTISNVNACYYSTYPMLQQLRVMSAKIAYLPPPARLASVLTMVHQCRFRDHFTAFAPFAIGGSHFSFRLSLPPPISAILPLSRGLRGSFGDEYAHSRHRRGRVYWVQSR